MSYFEGKKDKGPVVPVDPPDGRRTRDPDDEQSVDPDHPGAPKLP